MTKIEQIKALLESLDPNMSLIVEDRPDGSKWLIGPYPSFVIMTDLPGSAVDGYIISVNADAPQLVYFLKHVFAKFPDLEHYGPYCEDEENSSIVGGQDAYEMKEEILLKTAAGIFRRRKAEAEADANAAPKIIVPEQKIIVTGN